MTLENEKKFLLLLSSIYCKENATKKSVLDCIENKSWIKLNKEDKLLKANRNEEVWRNDLAFVRKHLEQEGKFVSNERNNWGITEKGYKYLELLYVDIVQSRLQLCKITTQALEDAKNIFINTDIYIYPDELNEADKIYEGATEKVIVNRYERNSLAREKCIEYYGCYCNICGLDFESIYGEIGKSFIHVHHIVPLSTINEKYEIEYKKDLLPVCPNCHAMLQKKAIIKK